MGYDIGSEEVVRSYAQLIFLLGTAVMGAAVFDCVGWQACTSFKANGRTVVAEGRIATECY